MLEAEKDDGQRKEKMDVVDVINSPTAEFFQRNGNEPASDYMQRERDRFVSFRVFMEEYWPHLPQPLTKNLGMFRTSTCILCKSLISHHTQTLPWYSASSWASSRVQSRPSGQRITLWTAPLT